MSLSALQIRYAPRVSGLGACEKPSGPSARMLQHFWELHARRPMHRDVRSYASNTVQLRLPDDSTVMLDVPEGSSILEVALDEGLDIPHDCKMGVCMNCAAKLEEGDVDQEAGMLSEDVRSKGYALLCVSQPHGNVKVRIIPEEELLDEVMN
ncbi:FDX4 [Auxenochlorella protothecoides x Auxenochlorella symbiontica]